MCTPTEEPLRTLPTAGHQSLIEPPEALVANYNGKGVCKPTDEPLGTLPTRDRFGLVERKDKPVAVEDCYFRMLEPHEIGAAMAFPSDYVVLGSKRDRVRQYGNAVTPPVMTQLLERCMATLR
jgi:DNA (cytosine-5)-methyltransferase 1